MKINEVDYRIMKWMLLNMVADGVISEAELHNFVRNLAREYPSPFSELDDLDGPIGDGVTVLERQAD